MPHTKSAVKRNRQSQERRARNRAVLKRIKTQHKKFETTLAGADKAAVAGDFNLAQKLVDQAAAKGVIHKNTANRRKARLARLAKKGTGAAK